ncbi:suppressor of SWI4 1 homolog isoform X2 [Chamaea fasciata]|uniref:suppressor of SWI4 1 homolog isoform X2 n=1 Tax=Chamaea fasciata TaxID=190680 RepID=UPI00336A7DEA
MGRPGKSRFQRAQRARARLRSEQEFGSAPHSFVFPRGRAGTSVRSLSRDLRRALEPFTARSLQVRRSNSLRDLVAVAGPLGVTHFLVLSKSQSGINLKIFRLPGGPTLTFKVLQYSLVRDVVSALRRHRMHEQQFLHPPLLVLGNFGAAQIHVKLMAGMFQGLFPALSVHRLNLNSIRRCLLISYDAESQLLEFRHYSIQVVPVGLSRGIRKILQEKFPNLGRAEDISDLLTGNVVLSESEAEPDGTQNVLELPQNVAGRGNEAAQQSAVRLTEIGPRLTLQLVKVEEGLGQGNVLYHGLAPKSEEELQELLARKERQLQVRAERRRRQEQNLERKRQQRLQHRERSLAGMRRASGDPKGDPKGGPKGGPGDPGGDSDVEEPGAPEAGEAEPSDEDEAEYYRQELGEEPDTDLFPGSSKRKRSPSGAPQARKRRKKNPKFHPGSQKSHPGHPGIPKSRPGTPKSQPGTPNSHHKTPKFQPGTSRSHPGSQKSRPGRSKNSKSQPRRPGTPKSRQETPKSHPGSQKSQPGHPKNPKSHRGKLLTPQKTPNFHRPRKARKGKN